MATTDQTAQAMEPEAYAMLLYCWADDRSDPVIQLSPPLICDQAHFVEMESILRSVLTEAQTLL